jgi:hypothetical protein
MKIPPAPGYFPLGNGVHRDATAWIYWLVSGTTLLSRDWGATAAVASPHDQKERQNFRHVFSEADPFSFCIKNRKEGESLFCIGE